MGLRVQVFRLMRWLHAVAFLFLAACAVQPASWTAAYDDPVVMVRMPDGHGTGFAVAPFIVVTSRHVVQNEKGVWLETVKGQRILATIQYIDKESDVAVLRPAEPLASETKLGCRRPRAGEAVKATGFPLATAWTTFWGHVASDHLLNTPAGDFLVLDIGVDSGLSGSPVWDSNGQVVGIVTGTLTEHAISDAMDVAVRSQIALAVPGDEVCRALARGKVSAGDDMVRAIEAGSHAR
jgi:S1-C subfamily serine protease